MTDADEGVLQDIDKASRRTLKSLAKQFLPMQQYQTLHEEAELRSALRSHIQLSLSRKFSSPSHVESSAQPLTSEGESSDSMSDIPVETAQSQNDRGESQQSVVDQDIETQSPKHLHDNPRAPFQHRERSPRRNLREQPRKLFHYRKRKLNR